jgi:hypothetical protein
MWRMRRRKKKEGGEETAEEQDISTKIRTHEQAFHCISEVMQFAIDQWRLVAKISGGAAPEFS